MCVVTVLVAVFVFVLIQSPQGFGRGKLGLLASSLPQSAQSKAPSPPLPGLHGVQPVGRGTLLEVVGDCLWQGTVMVIVLVMVVVKSMISRGLWHWRVIWANQGLGATVIVEGPAVMTALGAIIMKVKT